MMKPKVPKAQITYLGITFHSPEELWFYYWCEEALAQGYISNFNYHPESIPLTERVAVIKEVQKVLKRGTEIVHQEHFLFHPHEYTMDFTIRPTALMQRFKSGLFSTVEDYHIDVKGSNCKFRKGLGDERSFSINQKLVWFKTEGRVYVNKLVPKIFFKATWAPEKIRWTDKTKVLSKTWAGYRTVSVCSNLPLAHPFIKLVGRQQKALSVIFADLPDRAEETFLD